MFNWQAAPTFGAMLLFWLLAAYALTQVPTSAVSLAAVGAQVAAALYFLGEGMQANATTPDEWLPWARVTVVGAVVAPTLWYWLTTLLLREQVGLVDQTDPLEQTGLAARRHPGGGARLAVRRYLIWLGYPLGGVLAVGCLVVSVAAVVGESVFVWSAPVPRTPEGGAYFRYFAPLGLLYGAFAGLVGAAMLGAIVHLLVTRRLSLASEARRRVTSLIASAALFTLGVGTLLAATELALADWSIWLGHLVITAGMALMAANVAAYNLLTHGQMFARDLLYFLSALGLLCALYALVFVAVGPSFSFQVLGLLVAILLLTVAAHALTNAARRVFDRLFFSRDVQHLRAELDAAAQSAGRVEDLPALLSHAQAELTTVSVEHVVRLTEEALRRLNKPGKLAQSGLIGQIPGTLAAARSGDDERPGPRESASVPASPLQDARLLREALVAAIERLKPADPTGAGRALHYHILRDEYVLGRPIAQIMTRHGISEATFHRNRREAIASLAHELSYQEDLLARGKVESF